MLRLQGQRCLHFLSRSAAPTCTVRRTFAAPSPLLPLTTRRFKRTKSKTGGKKPGVPKVKLKKKSVAVEEHTEDHDLPESMVNAPMEEALSTLIPDEPVWMTLQERLRSSPSRDGSDEASVDMDPTPIKDPTPVKQKPRTRKAASSGSARKSALPPSKASKEEEALSNAGSRRVALGKAKMKPASDARVLRPSKLKLEPVEHDIAVPRLSYKLEQVLFTQGPNQLQDPRTQVFNFDPYLASIMPVDEFDFAALKEYITSSRDTKLRDMAKKMNKKYCGSTSSMTNTLSHFHFLLSAWRKPNYSSLSKGFIVESPDFTRLTRGPAAAYARLHNGVYAIDADKEYDTESILSMLGKSMEKLLTLPKEEFEKYRISRSHQISEEQRNADESYHYTMLGDFMMRSQLDAYDPRLPGAGVFDLKTRAVVTIRMDVTGYQKGTGYEIRYPRGQWESFEREYYDMIRAAFLKYSLQVRMGRMDGIFVAFHNTKRIFGFQYISLEEMDSALHGVDDRSLGDAEFKASVSLLNTLMDRATKRFPGRSLRMLIETRPTALPLTYFFVTPVTDEEIQTSKMKSQAAAERTAELLQEISRNQKVPAQEPEIANGEQPQNAVDESLDEKPDQPSPQDLESDRVWSELMTAVGEVVENDSRGLASVRGALQDALTQNDLLLGRTAEESEQYLDTLVDALTSSSPELSEDLMVADDKLVNSTDEAPEAIPTETSVTHADLETAVGAEKLASIDEQEPLATDQQTLLRDLIVKVTNMIDERNTELRTFEKVVAELAARSKTAAAADVENDDVKPEAVLDPSMESQAEVGEGKEDAAAAANTVSDSEAQSDISNEEAALATNTASSGDETNKDPTAEVAEGPSILEPTELLGMYITVRNQVGGKYVERLTTEDVADWTIQYSITELPDDQARRIYQSIEKRRKAVLITDAEAKDKQWYRAWGGKMSEMTRRGEEYRSLITKQEHGKPVYVSWGETPMSPEEAYTYDPDALNAGYRPSYEDEAKEWEDPEESEPTEENNQEEKTDEESQGGPSDEPVK